MEEGATNSLSAAGSSPSNSNKGDATCSAFTPISTMLIWQNSKCQKIESLLILLPGRVSEKSQSKVSVSDDGNQLK